MDYSLIHKTDHLKELLDLEQFRQLFAKETCCYWNHLWNIISYTKSYQQGIEIALTLLDKVERYKDSFNDKENECQLILIYSQFINMLDKADMWEDYLENWKIIKQKSIELKLGMEYSNSSRVFHLSRGGKDYFIGDTPSGFKLSFMYSQEERKKLIERKLDKAKGGKKIINYLHEQQEDLTAEEVKERYDWLINFFKTGEYDFEPPASRQKEERRKSKEKTIKI
jgi:hypothetical protein